MANLGEIAAAAVRAERARQKLTQRELADLLGWERSSISHLEAGRRGIRLEEIAPLCRALRVSLADLLARGEPADLRAIGLPMSRHPNR